MDTLPFSQRPTETPRGGYDDARFEFHSELPERGNRSGRGPLQIVTGVLVLSALTGVGVWHLSTKMAGAEPTGTLRVMSQPDGVAIEVDGSLRGLTPLTLALSPGDHSVVASLDVQKQEFSATISQGVESVHHVRFATEPAAIVIGGTGGLRITTDPAGATVAVDGVDRGASPLTVDGLAPGDHAVVVQSGSRTQRRTATVAAGVTAAMTVSFPSAPPAAPATGWLVTRASTPLQVFSRDRFIGTSEDGRLALPPGTHDLQFVADALGFRARRSALITAGQTTTVTVSLPQAPANFNAVPWAEVWVDGKAIGQTPLANLLLTIGTHDIEFRHPELGTKRTSIVVSLTEPARAAADMRVR
jgi:hypothetical protein